MLKICHIATGAPGGISRMVLNLIEEQRRDPELQVSVILLQEGAWSERFERTGIPVLRPQSVRGLRRWISVFRMLRQFDLGHLHVFDPMIVFASPWKKTPLLFTCHSVRGKGRVPHRFDRLREWLSRRFMSRIAGGTAFVSGFTREFWQARGVRCRRSAVVANGCPFPETPLEPPSAESFAVGTFATFGKVKRLDLLLKGFARFAQKNPDARLLMVGDGAERNNLEALARELKIDAATTFAGYQDDVASWIRKMNVVVIPSCEETFGLAAIEALYEGRPVIVCKDGGGLTEVLSGTPDSIVAPDIQCIADKLAQYRNAGQKYDMNALRESAMRYSMRNCVLSYKNFYLDLL